MCLFKLSKLLLSEKIQVSSINATLVHHGNADMNRRIVTPYTITTFYSTSPDYCGIASIDFEKYEYLSVFESCSCITTNRAMTKHL